VSEQDLDAGRADDEKRREVDKYVEEMRRSRPKRTKKLKLKPGTAVFWLRLTEEASLAMGFVILIEMLALVVIAFDLSYTLHIPFTELPMALLLQAYASVTPLFAVVGVAIALFFGCGSYKVGKIYGAEWLGVAGVGWIFSSGLEMILVPSTSAPPFAFGLTVLPGYLDVSPNSIISILSSVVWVIAIVFLAIGVMSLEHKTEGGHLVFVAALLLIGTAVRPIIPIVLMALGMALGEILEQEEK
jgi:hypothetical protein